MNTTELRRRIDVSIDSDALIFHLRNAIREVADLIDFHEQEIQENKRQLKKVTMLLNASESSDHNPVVAVSKSGLKNQIERWIESIPPGSKHPDLQERHDLRCIISAYCTENTA